MMNTSSNLLRLPSIFHAGQDRQCLRCGIALSARNGDSVDEQLCSDHRRASHEGKPLTGAELALVRSIGNRIGARQLTELINARRRADKSAGAALLDEEDVVFAMAQRPLQAPAGDGWAQTRKLLAKARRDGTLELVNEELIDAFAIVFSLNARQVMQLKDIVLPAKEQA